LKQNNEIITVHSAHFMPKDKIIVYSQNFQSNTPITALIQRLLKPKARVFVNIE